MEGFNFNNTVITNNSLLQTANSLGVFSVEDFNQWKNDKKTEEKGKIQTLDRTSHTDTSTYHGNHSNRSRYHNNNHSNGGGYHNNNHTDEQVQSGHANTGTFGPGAHEDVHIDTVTEPHETIMGDVHVNLSGGHVNQHVDNINGHIDVPEYSHSNTGHSNAIPHSNSGHSNHRPHRNSGHNNTVHGNTGFDHDNYIPSRPQLFEVDELADPKIIRDTTRIGLYSYDKNTDGDGTQDSQSKTVKFYMRIRKIKDIDGSSDVSPWKNLITNSTKDTYDLDTIDPLGVGNTDEKLTEGFYEIEAWAINDPKTQNGVSKTYESERKLVTVKIQQNIEPEITVANGDEFINFVFGPLGAADKEAGDYTLYENNLYTEAPQDKREGVFVTVNMKDDDIDQWQRGNIYLTDESNNKQNGTQVSIIWENGSEVIDSDNVLKTGYAFISKDKYLGLGLENAKLVLEVTDYKDAACLQPTGTIVKQKTISTNDLTELNFHIDIVAPIVNSFLATVLNEYEIKTNIQIVDTSSSGNHSGIPTAPYKYKLLGKRLDLSWEVVKVWDIDWIAGNTTEEKIFNGLQANRQYEIEIQVKDKVGNVYKSEDDGGFVNNIKYTHALSPTKVNITGVGNTDISVNIVGDSNNYEPPEYRLIAVPTDGNGSPVYDSSYIVVGPWSSNINQTISGLKEETQYILLVDTRNGDNYSIYTAGDTPTPTELNNIKNNIPSGSDLDKPIFTNRSPSMNGISANKSILSSTSGHSLLGDALEANTSIALSGTISDDDDRDKIKIYYSFDIDTFDSNMPTVGTEVISTGVGFTGDPFVSSNTIDIANLPIEDKTVALAGELSGNKLKDGVHILRLWAVDHRGAVSYAPVEITINVDNTAPDIVDAVNIDISAITRTSHKINLPNANDVDTGTNPYKVGVSDSPYRVSKQLDGGVFEAVSEWLLGTETEYIIDSLKSNAPYNFKVEVRDKLNNISEVVSNQKYTLAKLPTGTEIISADNTAVTIKITSNPENYIQPEHRLIAVPTDADGNPVYGSSDVVVGNWSAELTQTISGLKEETAYIIIVDVKNGDGVSQFTGDNNSGPTTPMADQLKDLKDANGSDITDTETSTPVYTNRTPEFLEMHVSEGDHHKGKPLEIKLTTKELDINDKLKIMYKIEGLPGYTLNQIQKPALLEGGYNIEHTTPYKEFTCYIDLTEEASSGIYGIEVWVEDIGGRKSGSKSETFKVYQEAYYLDDIESITENGTDTELKEAIQNILGNEFADLYYPNPIPSNMGEAKYLNLTRQEISKLIKPIKIEDIKESLAIVNINVKLSIGREKTITEKELKLTLLDNSDIYIKSYLSDYQKELRIMYNAGGEGVMRLTYDDIHFAVKFVNFKKKAIGSITPQDIRYIVGSEPIVYDEYIEDYREAIGDINNPTLKELKEAIKLININKKIENGTITISDLKTLLPDTEIIQDYLSEYIRYLQMYQNDLERNLTVDEIRDIIESVNAVMEYEANKTNNNHTDANNNVNRLEDGNTKKELLSRIAKLDGPKIDFAVNDISYDISDDKDIATIASLKELTTSSRNSFIQFLEGKINSITIKYLGNKTILVRNGKAKIKITNLEGAKEFRFIEMNGLKNENQDWQKIKDEKIEENISFNQQGFYSGGIQIRNKAGVTSSVTNIDFIIDDKKPTGKIEKFIPMQSATKKNYIRIKLKVNDNLNVPIYAKINNRWDIIPTDYFDYELNGEAELKVIEIQISDLCGNKETLKDTIWKIK